MTILYGKKIMLKSFFVVMVFVITSIHTIVAGSNNGTNATSSNNTNASSNVIFHNITNTSLDTVRNDAMLNSINITNLTMINNQSFQFLPSYCLSFNRVTNPQQRLTQQIDITGLNPDLVVTKKNEVIYAITAALKVHCKDGTLDNIGGYRIVLRQLATKEEKNGVTRRSLIAPYVALIRYTIVASKTSATSILSRMEDKLSNSALYWFNKDPSFTNVSLTLDLPFVPQVAFHLSKIFQLNPSDIVVRTQKTILSPYDRTSSSQINKATEQANISSVIGIGMIALVVIVALILYVFYIKATHEEREKERISKLKEKALETKAKFKDSNATRSEDSNMKKTKRKKHPIKVFNLFNKKKNRTKKSIAKLETPTGSNVTGNTSLQQLKELELRKIDSSSI
jgi:hypothetical protein